MINNNDDAMTKTTETNQSIFQIYLNLYLLRFFKSFAIQTVPFLGEHALLDLINNDFFVQALKEGTCEGFVLTFKNGPLFKWKPLPCTEHRANTFETLQNAVFPNPDEKHYAAGLKSVCFESKFNASNMCDDDAISTTTTLFSSLSLDNPIYTKIIIHHLYYSAISKFPLLTDYLEAEINVANWKLIKQKYYMLVHTEIFIDVRRKQILNVKWAEIEQFVQAKVRQQWMKMDPNMMYSDLDDEEVENFFRLYHI